MTDLELNAEEAEAMGLLNASLNQIMGWGLRHNQNELIQAVHVIQGFIIQHMLARVSPQFSDWYGQRDNDAGG